MNNLEISILVQQKIFTIDKFFYDYVAISNHLIQFIEREFAPVSSGRDDPIAGRVGMEWT